jgi:glutathione S-transferase
MRAARRAKFRRMLQLYTFTISHFSEKARWALDHEGITYREKVLVPGPHQLVTRRYGKRTSVPLLEHDGRYVQGSSEILDYLADMLGGKRLTSKDGAQREQALALEQRMNRAFGLGVQRILYSEMVKHRAALTELWAAGGPFWARPFFSVAYPVVVSAVQRMYRTTDRAAVDAAKQLFLTTFDELDATLERQRYLGGDAPDRTDITAAALLAPVCAPPEHIVKWPAVPAELLGFQEQLRGRPTWNHVLRMYREHRRVREAA